MIEHSDICGLEPDNRDRRTLLGSSILRVFSVALTTIDCEVPGDADHCGAVE
jgi:hypothetical protein